jgi:hypothetical protein
MGTICTIGTMGTNGHLWVLDGHYIGTIWFVGCTIKLYHTNVYYTDLMLEMSNESVDYFNIDCNILTFYKK